MLQNTEIERDRIRLEIASDVNSRVHITDDGCFIITNDPYVRDDYHLSVLVGLEDSLVIPDNLRDELVIYSDFISENTGYMSLISERFDKELIRIEGKSYWKVLVEFASEFYYLSMLQDWE